MKKMAERTVYRGRWLEIQELDFQSEDGEIFTWEKVDRPHDQGGMTLVAQFQPSGHILLLRQYRPVLEKHIIGFPGGLAENGDIAGEALRELKEETGYEGEVISISPDLRNNPSLLNDKVYIVRIQIDENNPNNCNPQPTPEVSEEIEVFRKLPGEIPQWLQERHQAGDYVGIGPWYTFCTWE